MIEHDSIKKKRIKRRRRSEINENQAQIHRSTRSSVVFFFIRFFCSSENGYFLLFASLQAEYRKVPTAGKVVGERKNREENEQDTVLIEKSNQERD